LKGRQEKKRGASYGAPRKYKIESQSLIESY
jgi:hypothetical protein